MRSLLVYLLFVFLYKVQGQDEDIFCSKEFCETYLEDNTCVDVPRNCKIQNSTHNGLVLPFPGPCNCCDYCLSNIDENEQCATGSPSSPTPTSICSDGLSCTSEGTCQKIVTPCTEAQDLYDEKYSAGTLGHLEVRPVCDRLGEYGPFKCIPGELCYCLSENGERIFGEIEFLENPEDVLTCECSRNYNKATEIFGEELNPAQHFRCTSSGDYDQIQCIGNYCYCVEVKSGNLLSEDQSPVNMSSISATTLECFNDTIHEKGKYYRECESLYLLDLDEIKEYEDEGLEVLGYDFPNCQLDGFYGPVQHNITSKFCTDPKGLILENFVVDISSELADSMNCKCARARSLISSDDAPACCPNGNYKSIQCRRGLCRCVDTNGNQVGKEVEQEVQNTLPCSNELCTST